MGIVLVKSISVILFLASSLSTLYTLLRLPLLDRNADVHPVAVVTGLFCSTLILVITGWYLTVML